MKRMVCKLQQMNIRIRYDDDDDEDSIQVKEYYESLSTEITPEASKDSLIMGDEPSSTSPEMESSSVDVSETT